MTELTIGRLDTSVSGWPAEDTARVPAMLEGVATHRLDAALRAAPLPTGDWCVRRVDLELALDPGRPSGALEAAWAETIVSSLHQAMRDPASEVLHFARHEDALDDLLTGLVVGRIGHEWAWRQVGLLESTDPDPQQAPRDLLLRVLQRQPNGAAGAVVRLVLGAGLAAVHRLIGTSAWSDIGRLVAGGREDRGLGGPPRPATHTECAEDSAADLLHQSDTSGAQPASRLQDDGRRRPGSPGRPTAVSRLAASLVARSTFAAAAVASGLRVDHETRRAWALVLLADLAPTELDRDTCPQLVEVVAALLRSDRPSGLQTSAVPRPMAPTPEDDTSRPVATTSEQRQGPGGALPRATADGATQRETQGDTQGDTHRDTARETDEPPPEDSADGAATAWAGLVFLLNTAEELGLPGVVDQQAALGGRPVPWVLQQIGLRLVPATADDPAVLALAGIDPASPWHREPRPADREVEALDELSSRWASCTADRFHGPEPTDDAPVDVVRRIAERPGTVLSEPGWTEVVMSQHEIDLDIRRAGLDLDPGWVWWLGSVVRFRYA